MAEFLKRFSPEKLAAAKEVIDAFVEDQRKRHLPESAVTLQGLVNVQLRLHPTTPARDPVRTAGGRGRSFVL